MPIKAMKNNVQSTSPVFNSRMFSSILSELRLLRKEVLLLLPQEDLEEYVDENRIKKAYLKALKKYPPITS